MGKTIGALHDYSSSLDLKIDKLEKFKSRLKTEKQEWQYCLQDNEIRVKRIQNILDKESKEVFEEVLEAGRLGIADKSTKITTTQKEIDEYTSVKKDLNMLIGRVRYETNRETIHRSKLTTSRTLELINTEVSGLQDVDYSELKKRVKHLRHSVNAYLEIEA